MDSIGERLRRRREELGLSIEQAAEATKFRPELIEAVEAGRAGVFSAEVYRDGFIRTYAGLLNLDGDNLLRDQKTEEERAHEAIRGLKIRPARSRVSPKVLAGVLALVVVGIVAAVLIGRAGKGDDAGRRQDGALGSSESDSAARGRGRARNMRHIAGAKAPDSLPSPRAVELQVSDTTRGGARVRADGPSEGPQAVVGGQVAGSSERTQGMAGGEAGAPRESTQPTVATQVPRPEGAGPERTAPAEQAAPGGTDQAAPAPVTGGSSVQTGARMRTLEIVANRSSNFTVKSGERIILNDYWLRRGERVVRTDTGPFVIVTLSDWQGVSITLDGKPVRLPLSDSPELFDWPIPSDR